MSWSRFLVSSYPMKIALVALCAAFCVPALSAAESPLEFGDAQIGIPPLSLGESARSALAPKSFKFMATFPSFSSGEPSAAPGPTLLPRTTPRLADIAAAAATRKSRLSPNSRMPILDPNPAVDYRMKVHAPDPTIDFKLVINTAGDPEAK
jgi:hypothetical protein